MNTSVRPLILYVDDEQSNLDTFLRSFRFDYRIMTALSADDAIPIIKEHGDLAAIITDLRMPGTDGISFLREAIRINPYPTRIVLTAFSDNSLVLKAIQEGHVYDYVIKPWDPDVFGDIISRAVKLHTDRIDKIRELEVAQNKNSLFENDAKLQFNCDFLIGAERGLLDIAAKIQKIAGSNSAVLIRGESGTGKELIARAIHENSARKNKSFIKVNCAALSPGILESELFGHEKGAFTGAGQRKIGRFELADGGTLFLDEIGDLPPDVQVKILRVLQEKEFERVGGTQLVKADFRLLTATHRNMELLVQQGKFREDLYFRINVIPLAVPALRDRKQDIPVLAQYFVDLFSRDLGKRISLSDAALSALCDYDWPGNVRELKNAIERAVVLAEETELKPYDFSHNLIASNQLVCDVSQTPLAFDFRDSLQNAEAQELAAALRNSKGNISKAARETHLPRSTLVHRLKKHGLI